MGKPRKLDGGSGEQHLSPTQDLVKILAISGLVLIAAGYDLYRFAGENGYLSVSIKWSLGLFGLFLGGGLALLLAGLLSRNSAKPFARAFTRLRELATRLGSMRYPLAISVLLFPSFLFLGSLEETFKVIGLRALIGWLVIVVASELFVSTWNRYRWIDVILGAGILLGVLYRLSLFVHDISAYPFSLGWSESSRYYYASLFFARRLYGEHINPSVLHPTRYMMQSLPFIIPSLPLWFHRLWQVGLWITLTSLTGVSLARRLDIPKGWKRTLFTGFTIIYLFQGPVYYHLLMMVVLILWGTDTKRLHRSTVLIVIASIWAGMSRLNWYPVPAMLAAALYVLEMPRASRSSLRYFAWPAAWIFFGFLTAVLTQYAYVSVSGNPLDQFGSSLNSQLLWPRLWSNETFPLGLVPAVGVASLPMLALIWFRRRMIAERMGSARWLVIPGMLFVLLAGGLVVSIKIGGGSNLHNMDAYLVLLGVVGAYLYTQRIEPRLNTLSAEGGAPPAIMGLIVLVPLLFVLGQGQPLILPSLEDTNSTLQTLQFEIDQVDESQGKVLFISQRHLVTFGAIRNAEFEHDYETVFLMEMAMARHEPYLERFREALEEHAFSLIVAGPQNTNIQGPEHSFDSENNAWVIEVSTPILCYYEPIATNWETGVQLFAPREESCTTGHPSSDPF